MRKILISVLLFTLVFSLFACGEDSENADSGADSNGLSGVADDEIYYGGGLAFKKTTDGRYYTVVGIEALAEEEIYIPNTYNGKSVKSISDRAFAGNTNIKSLTVEDGIEKIGPGAFSGCTSLENVIISKNLEKIGSSAFEGCSSLKTLIFGKGVTDIGKNAFLGCSSIENFYYEGTISDFSKITGITVCELSYNTRYFYSLNYPSAAGYFWHWSENSAPLVWEDYIGNTGLKFEISADGTYYKVMGNSNASDKTVLIPKAHKGLPVGEIDAMAFVGAYMEEIILPETVTRISGAAFKWCSKLKSINLPNGITFIGESAFLGCTSLESVTLPQSIAQISDNAFLDCTALASVIIPDSIAAIGKDAFHTLTKIYYEADEEAWSAVSTAESNIPASNVYFYCEEKPVRDGNFWSLGENGEIIVWY